MPEDWRFKILTDAIGNALGTGLGAAVVFLYANAIGVITVHRRAIIGTVVFIVAMLWNISLWYLADLAARWLSRWLANVLVFVGGQLAGFLLFVAILAPTGQSVQPVSLAMLLGLGIVAALKLLQALRDEATDR